ncbi:autotransporter outer membrane beta-barrel domain-containing protein [Psychromonas algicola]|uniref:autotransporter outer membrane beta-barrel domain-containing protein n=1 Tax=Psychromonas algicola TaxID=2555642 RepID=UPI00106837E7|nr:autotransporter domain-containing protein [Psychromonas sp. RZ5]TEW51889.1 autotransporter domain-containing protein [Psychromonas sp. RZ5]
MFKKITTPIILLTIGTSLTPIVWADEFIIDTAETTSNAGNTIDGDDSITVTENGAINTSTLQGRAIDTTGDSNTITNNGSMSSNHTGIRSIGNNNSLTNNNELSGLFSSFYLEGDENSVTNAGEIEMVDQFSTGIYVEGESNTILNSGSILISNDEGEQGISVTGDSNQITNSGTITTFGAGGSGSLSHGIATDGINNIITNGGIITTNGADAYGINADGDNNTITNSGTIETAGADAYGIYSIGENANISNTGDISTSGGSAHALYSDGGNATIINNGSISAIYYNSLAFVSTGENSTITNNGSIFTTDLGANAMALTGDNSTVINNGSISTTYRNSDGLWLIGDYIDFTNTGTITTSSTSAEGLYVNGYSADITNTGSISTEAGSSTFTSASHAIYVSDQNINITNTGTLSTLGEQSSGIYVSEGDGTIISNTGNILVEGKDAHGIYLSDYQSNTTITNSGTISATGEGGYAILGSDLTDTTVNLLAGSTIIGGIDLGGTTDNDTLNVYASGINQTLTAVTETIENINIIGGTGIITDSGIMTLDTANEASRSTALASSTASIHSIARQRMLTNNNPTTSPLTAALELSPSMLYQEQAPVFWSQVFGGSLSHEATDTASAYDTNHLGFTLGYERDFQQSRMGLMLGLVNTTTDSTDSFENTTSSFYTGAYYSKKLGWMDISSSLLAGYATNDNKRYVNGSETAKSDFTSVYLSPSVTASSTYIVVDNVEIQPAASLDLTLAQLSSYKESGTTVSDLDVDSRNLQSLRATIQLATIYHFSENMNTSFTAGISALNTNDEDISLSVDGNSLTYSADNGTGTTPFVGVDFNLVDYNDFNISVGLSAGSNSDENYTNGHLDVQYQF